MRRPETSERHHGPFLAGRVPLSPVRMSCPRGDPPLTYMPAVAGELVLGASDLWLSKSCRSCP
jgi:hypothetical protein